MLYTDIELTSLALQLAGQWQDGFLQSKKANQDHATNAMTIQTYAISVKGQARVNSPDPSFKTFTDQCNQYLGTAQSHADDYLNNIHGNILDQVSSLKQFCIYIQSVGNAISTGQVDDQAAPGILTALGDIQSEGTKYKSDSQMMQNSIGTFRGNVGADASNFSTVSSNFQNVMTGKKGKLEDLNKQLAAVIQQINADMQQQAKAAADVKNGIIKVVVGAVGEIFTLGAATPILLAGIKLVSQGKAEEKQIAADLKDQLKKKNDLVVEIHNIQQQLCQVQGIHQGYTGLDQKAQNAQTAAQGMVDAWGGLIAGLGKLLDSTKDLDNKSAFKLMVQLFSQAFLSNVSDVVDNVTQIENQMKDLHTQGHAMLMGMPNWVALRLGQGYGSMLINYNRPVYDL